MRSAPDFVQANSRRWKTCHVCVSAKTLNSCAKSNQLQQAFRFCKIFMDTANASIEWPSHYHSKTSSLTSIMFSFTFPFFFCLCFELPDFGQYGSLTTKQTTRHERAVQCWTRLLRIAVSYQQSQQTILN